MTRGNRRATAAMLAFLFLLLPSIGFCIKGLAIIILIPSLITCGTGELALILTPGYFIGNGARLGLKVWIWAKNRYCIAGKQATGCNALVDRKIEVRQKFTKFIPGRYQPAEFVPVAAKLGDEKILVTAQLTNIFPPLLSGVISGSTNPGLGLPFTLP